MSIKFDYRICQKLFTRTICLPIVRFNNGRSGSCCYPKLVRRLDSPRKPSLVTLVFLVPLTRRWRKTRILSLSRTQRNCPSCSRSRWTLFFSVQTIAKPIVFRCVTRRGRNITQKPGRSGSTPARPFLWDVVGSTGKVRRPPERQGARPCRAAHRRDRVAHHLDNRMATLVSSWPKRSCHARSVRATAATRRAGARIEKKLLCPMCPMTENAAIA